MPGQDSLSVSDPLYNVPWQNFLLNSSIILGITFSIPVGINMLMHSFRPDSKFDPEMFDFFRTAPWVFGGTLLAGLLLDRYNSRVQKFFRESSRFRVCCPSAKITDQELCCGQEQPLVNSGRRRADQSWLSWLMKLLAFSLLPLITWSSPMIWLDGVAEAYVGCAFACHATGHIKKYKDIEFCGNVTSFSDMFEPGKSKWPKARLESSFGTKSPKAVLGICKKIFDIKKTKWAEEMQGRDMFFVTFEALLRHYHHVSSVEVFGSLLGGVIIVLWLVIDAALSTKTKELVTYRNTFLRQNMMVRASTIEKYAKLFLHLNSLQNGSTKRTTQEYSVKILQTAMKDTINEEKGANVEKHVANAFEKYGDADGDGTDDNAQARGEWFTWACLGRELACLLLALVHVSVPAVVKLFLKRRQSLHHQGVATTVTAFVYEEFLSAFLSDGLKLRPAILCNLIVGFVAYYLLFRGLAVAFERYRHKFDQLLAFRCMWRFPDENPLEDVNIGAEKMSDFIKKKDEDDSEDNIHIPTLQQQDNRGVEQPIDVEQQIIPYRYKLTRSDDNDSHLLSAGAANSKSWKDLEQRRYRFDFSHRFFPKLFDEVPRLSEWYNMRRYIQIDCVDERIATEMFSTLAVVCLLWKLVMVLINWIAMNNDAERKLQIVNFESLYDAAVIAVLLLLSLTLTLQFNDEFARHHQQVNSLPEHLKLVQAGDSIKQAKKKRQDEEALRRSKTAGEGGGTPGGIADTKGKSSVSLPAGSADPVAGTAEEMKRLTEQAEEAEKYILTICQGVQKFDRPATIFGLSVNRELIGGVGSFVAISAAPVALKMMQSIVIGDTEGAE